MSDRAKVLDKLKKLMAMTSDNGASEAEAMVAAKRAADLMAEHNLSFTSVAEIEAEAFVSDKRQWFRNSTTKRRPGRVPPVKICLPEIGRLTGTEHLYHPWTGELVFFGPPHACEIAHYLVVIISRAMQEEWNAYKRRLRPNDAASKRASFFSGIGYRIAQRLGEMHTEQRRAPSTGADLVLVRDALVKARFAERHPDLKESNIRLIDTDQTAVRAGWDAGANVALNQGVNEASGILAITRKEVA